MATPFDDFDKQKAKKILGDNKSPLAAANRKFIEGDHWQNGDGWIGPAPQSTEEGYSETMAQISRAFISRNVIAEVVERHVGGVLGREPSWDIVPIEDVEDGEDEEDEDLRIIIEALKGWWDDKKVHKYMKQVASNSLWAERSCFRFYVPSGLRNENGGIDAEDIAEALSYIYPDAPNHEDCIVYEDEDTKSKLGVLLFRTDDGEKENFELVYLNDEGETVIRQIMADGEDTLYPLPLSGQLTIEQVEKYPLINTQVQQCQKALNLAVSMLPRNIVTGGFLERVLLNAQMPGEWETDDQGNRTKFVPTTLNVGAGTTNFFRGIDYEEQDPMTGKTRTLLATPQVKWREPVEVRPATEAKRSHYEDILEEVDQSHILKQQHANASGKSLEQARADFLNSLRDTKIQIDGLGRWVFRTVLAMAEALLGKDGAYTEKYRVVFDSRIDPGPVGSDEKQQFVNASEKQIISRRTARRLSGVQDIDAEEKLIAEQEDSILNIRTKQAEALKAYVDAGVKLSIAAKIIGMPEDEITLIGESDGISSGAEPNT